jgi:hypothetical protein
LITDEGKIYMVPGMVNDVYYLRFALCAEATEKLHVDYAWSIILKFTDIILTVN